MSNPRPPRGAPGRDPRQEPRLRPSEERLASASRTTRRIAVAALVLAVAGVGLVAWRLLLPAAAGCQTAAWDATPATARLPTGWSITASQYDLGRKSMTLTGALADDGYTQAVIYATITCYPDGAADSVDRSSAAAQAAGQAVTPRDDLGEQGFLAADDSGAQFLQFRHADVVVYLAASGDATAAELETAASAFDIAMGGDGGETAVGTPDTGGASPSDDASPDASAGASPGESPAASVAAPDLEALIPASVGGITLTVESAIGTDILADDQGSRAITAALRAAGKSPDDLRVAQAYDANGESDLSILAVRVVGMEPAALKDLVMSAWLAASGAGVKEETVTLSGRELTRIDYGDGGTRNYILAEGDTLRMIETADADLAAQAAAALP